MKIYDCFLFMNELDLLEIRLNELNEIVDKFVIVESDTTFTGINKGYVLEKNKHLFEKFWHKIEYIKHDSPYKIGINMEKALVGSPSYEDFNRKSWINNEDQRDSCVFGLTSCEPEDVVMISDLDEIPNKDCLEYAFTLIDQEPLVLFQQFFYYYINCAVFNSAKPDRINNWFGTTLIKYKNLLNTTPQKLRDEIHSLPTLTDKNTNILPGWHYSFLGGVNRIKEKMQASAHVEYNSEEFLDLDKLKKLVSEGKDIMGRNEYIYKILKLEDLTILSYIKENKERFKHLIYD